MADLKGLFSIIEPHTAPKNFTAMFDDGREEARKGPQSFIGDGCAYFDHRYSKGKINSGVLWLKAWVTFAFYLDGDDDDGYGIGVEWRCDPPHPDHFLSYLEDVNGLISILEWDNWGYSCLGGEDDTERILIEQGIAPGQRFVAEILFTSSRDYLGEYDEYLHGRVMDIEPWTPEQVLSAWEDYYLAIHETPPTIGEKDVSST